MITRRALVFMAATGLLAAASRTALADPPTADDPVAIINAIYARVAKGKGDGGGGFIMENRAAKTKYLSKSLAELWAKADAHTQKGDVGPVEFDPATNSQDPDVKSFTVNPEKSDAASALVAVTITGRRAPRGNAADAVIRYNFVRDGDHWKIDDIKGAVEGKPWSIRGILRDSLKY
jgi:hypothetical protein